MYICENCNKEVYVYFGSGRFCNNSCSKSYASNCAKGTTKKATCQKCNKVIDIKLRASSKNFICPKCKEVIKQCLYCNKDFVVKKNRKKFCSRVCQGTYNVENTNMSVVGGKASALVQCRRSKDEIKLYNLCKDRYGIDISHNEIVIEGTGWDADIIIRNKKIAIMWNGPWHYKEMGIEKVSLKQIQKRDELKKKLFEDNGWRVLVFEDHTYTPETAFEEVLKCAD